MSFHTKIIAACIAGLVSTAAFADDNNQPLVNFSIDAFSSGDVFGTGSPNTVFNATKHAFNQVELSAVTSGIGCGENCYNQNGNASAHVGEMAFLDSSTFGQTSGQLFGSSAGINLEAQTQLVVPGTTLRDTTKVNVAGDVYGVGVGDTVSVFTQRHATGSVQQNMTYHGDLCPGVCGDVVQNTQTHGALYQAALVTAHGHEAIAISNVTDGSVSALIENYKGATPGS